MRKDENASTSEFVRKQDKLAGDPPSNYLPPRQYVRTNANGVRVVNKEFATFAIQQKILGGAKA